MGVEMELRGVMLKLAAVAFLLGVAGGLVGFFIGVVGVAWLTGGTKVLGGPWWDVVSAFGTFLAAALALFFWVYQRRKETVDQRALAKAVAARLVISMRGPVRQLKELADLACMFKENYDGNWHLMNDKKKRFEQLLSDVKPFYTDSDCRAFDSVKPGVAGRLALALGCYEELRDRSLLSTTANNRYERENLKTLGVAIQSIRYCLKESRREFYILRKELTMRSSETKEWIEW